MNQRYLANEQLVRPEVVALDHLTVRHPQSPVLRDFSLHIYDGQAVAILGESGAGKTLLLACLQGLVRPAGGHMTLFGAPVPPISGDIRRSIGVMPHRLHRRDGTTVQDVLHTFAQHYEIRLQQNQLEDYTNRYDLAPSLPLAHMTPLQKRVLALAVSVIHDPRLVLLDEPLSGLSEPGRRIADSYVRQMQREGRTLVVTFEQSVAHTYLSAYDVIITL